MFNHHISLLSLHQSSKTLILPHLRRLLGGEELDKLGQFLARGIFELACGFERHDFGEDREEGRGEGDHCWIGFLICCKTN